MNEIVQLINRGVDELLGRASGPLNFRLFVMPTVVTLIAIRAAWRDARQDKSPFVWAILTNQRERAHLLRSTVKDIARIFVVAVVLDTAYQLFVLKAFHIGQVLIVAVACAIVPYLVVRGPLGQLMRFLRRREAGTCGS